MKQFVLVPEEEHRQWKANKNEALRAIHRPEEREMLKRYELAQNLLHEAKRTSDETKLDEYHEAMQDVTLLRDRQTRVQQQQPTHQQPTKQAKEEDNVDLVNALPASQQTNARKLMQILQTQGDGIVSWTRNGDVQIHGQRVRGANIADLVSDVVRSTPSKTSAPERERFLSALAKVNVPETLVKNKSALEQYRVIKSDATTMDGIAKDDEEDVMENVAAAATTTNEPVTKRRLKESDWNAPL